MQLAAGSQARSLGAQQQCASIQKMRVSLLPLSRPLQPVRLSRAAVMVRAEAGGGLGGFFGKKSEKEDAARKALEDALKGKKDPFAAAEKRAKKYGGGGGGGDGGGGGGGGSGGFNFGDFGDKFGKGLRSLLNTLGAVLLFAVVLFGISLWKPLLALLIRLVRIVLRLDGNPRMVAAQQALPTADLSKKEGLGNVEESVISKYGGDAAADEDEEEDEDEEDEE